MSVVTEACRTITMMDEEAVMRPRGFLLTALIWGAGSFGVLAIGFGLMSWCSASSLPGEAEARAFLFGVQLFGPVAVLSGTGLGITFGYLFRSDQRVYTFEEPQAFLAKLARALDLKKYRRFGQEDNVTTYRRNALSVHVVVEMQERVAKVVGPHFILGWLDQTMRKP
jgi:hypothetical protein